MTRPALLALCLCSTVSTADEHPWETQRTEPIVIKSRSRAGSAVKEIWAEATVKASTRDIQQAITDVTRFTVFFPYMTESRFVGDREADGARHTYARLDVPVLSPRDFVHKAYLDRDSATDPAGVFANHWFAVPTKLPEVAGVVRLKISEGSWLVTPTARRRTSSTGSASTPAARCRPLPPTARTPTASPTPS